MKICKLGHGRDNSVKECKVCRRVYLAQYKENNAQKLKTKTAAYYSKNKDAILVKQVAYRDTRKDKKSVVDKKYREANRDTLLAKRKEYYQLNIVAFREAREKYYLENKPVFRALARKRQLSILERIPPWYRHEDMVAIYQLRTPGYHIDHIIPLQGELVSGLHWAHNLQLLPASINRQKSNKFDPDTYVHELPFY